MSELIPNHKILLAQLDSISQNTVDIEETEKIIQTVDITLINSSAWEMAKVTNATFYINFDDINNLAKVYNLQSYYESIVKQYVLLNLIKYQNSNEIDQLENTKQFLESIIPMEEDSQKYYDIILNEILKKYNR